MPLVAFASCRELPEADQDVEVLSDECHRVGLAHEYPAWDDPDVDWSRYDLVVLHSTWNYYEDYQGFEAWVKSTSSLVELWNPAPLVLRTIDKRYLGDLEAQGVPIVPTRYVNDESELRQAIEESGWEAFVLKPTVSASSYMTRVFDANELDVATEFLNQILRSRGAMAQQYMSKVANGGEIALVHIDGELTHGVIKSPRFHGGFESVSEAVMPSFAQAEVARRVMATLNERWMYGRIDLMEDKNGEWRLSEMELIEPSLFLLQHPPACGRFVSAVKRLAYR